MNLRIVTDGLRSAKEYASRMFSFDRLSKNVEAGLYAATVKGILLYKIEIDKRLISYGDLAQATSQLPKGGQLAQALQKIAEDDQTHGRPLSTCIVVNEATKMPGDGFFRQCLDLGHKFEETPTGRLLFWRAMLKSLGVVTDRGSDEWVSVCGALDLNIEKSSEIDTLQSLWSLEELQEAKAAAEATERQLKQYRSDPHTKGAGRPAISTLFNDRPQPDRDSPPPPDPVVRRLSGFGDWEQQKKRAFASGVLRVPPRNLQKGDVVLGVDNQELVVASVTTQGETGGPDIVIWTDTTGRQHRELAVGSHRRVKRAAEPSVAVETEPQDSGPARSEEGHSIVASVEMPGGLLWDPYRLSPYDSLKRTFPTVAGLTFRYIHPATSRIDPTNDQLVEHTMSEKSAMLLCISAPPNVKIPKDKLPGALNYPQRGVPTMDVPLEEYGYAITFRDRLPTEGEIKSWTVVPTVEELAKRDRGRTLDPKPSLEDVAWRAAEHARNTVLRNRKPATPKRKPAKK